MKRQSASIRLVRIKDLVRFAEQAPRDPAFASVMPTTPARARSQALNPWADTDDPALLVAFVDGRCTGYFGLLPGMLACAGRLDKIFYATTFFVAPAYRNQGLGAFILNEVMRLNLDVVLTGMTEGAKSAYRRAGFEDLGLLTYYQLRLDRLRPLAKLGDAFDSDLAGILSGAGRPGAFLLQIDDRVYRQLKNRFYRRCTARFAASSRPYGVRQVDRIDERRFPDRTDATAAGFLRGGKVLNWMLDYPWIVSAPQKPPETKHYFFSAARDLFRYIALEVFRPATGDVIGYVLLSVSRRRSQTLIKLLDHFLPDPDSGRLLAELLLTYARSSLADRIEYSATLAPFINPRRCLKPLIKRRKRRYMICPRKGLSPLAAARKDIVLNYCDADIAFV